MAAWEYMTTPLIVHNTAAILNNWGRRAGSSCRSSRARRAGWSPT
ncbi:hypothetical protein [Naasia aerilata]|nr:hypothetical protein [Naasia aerilata]